MLHYLAERQVMHGGRTQTCTIENHTIKLTYLPKNGFQGATKCKGFTEVSSAVILQEKSAAFPYYNRRKAGRGLGMRLTAAHTLWF